MIWNKICEDVYGLEYFADFDKLLCLRMGDCHGLIYKNTYPIVIDKNIVRFMDNKWTGFQVLFTIDGQIEYEFYLAYKKWLISNCLKEKLSENSR